MTTTQTTPRARYTNPVYPGYFADPFVLRAADGLYYAYGTGPLPEGDLKHFPVLRSADLAHWEMLGGALEPLQDPPAFSYWAPEVAERDGGQGGYYMYYSASTSHSDEHHRIRIAIADRPEGPFRDSGKILIPQIGFSIDASPFRDPADGTWYLFFATDYETEAPFGTGLAVVRLGGDMLSTTSEPRLVVRASADWQIYERNRNYKGKTWAAWNCVEGPSVVEHGGKYYCFYSGGAWHTVNYGVGYAVADHPLGPWRDDFAAHGPAVLKGIEGSVLGPGHNSTMMGPDGRTLYMAYHAWDPAHTARRMFIDPIRWTPNGPKVDGPSVTERAVE